MVQGIRVQGIRVQGIRVQGISVQGIRVQGIRVSGEGAGYQGAGRTLPHPRPPACPGMLQPFLSCISLYLPQHRFLRSDKKVIQSSSIKEGQNV